MTLFTALYKVPFQIDDDDLFVVSHYTWHVNLEKGYIQTNIRCGAKQKGMRLHQLLLGKPPEDLEWDHINQDKTDNRRANFRLATRSVQTRNSPMQANNTSGVRGINKNSGRWIVRIGDGTGNRIHVGRFDSFEEAVVARTEAEEVVWGKNR